MLKRKLKRFLSGVNVLKEYPCVDPAEYNDEVVVTLITGGKQRDITYDHLFLGYKPLVAGIYSAVDIHSPEAFVTFTHRNGTKLARLRLNKIESRSLGSHWLVLFEGTYAVNYFLPAWNRVANTIFRRLRKRITGNIEMEGNEYQQVQAMYSVPRKISVISVGGDGRYNMFPTDLHGNAGSDFYVDSLRKKGKACSQVLQWKRIIKSDISFNSMNDAFAMGKNHMKELTEASDFAVSGYSALFKLPLPKGVVQYKELELHDHIEIGIHRILIFKVQHEEIFHAGAPVLACTNSHYIQWRLNHSLPANHT